MKRNVSLVTVGFLLLFSMLIGCAAHTPQVMFQPEDLSGPVNKGDLVKKVDAFMVIFDASASMGESYAGTTKMDFARQIVNGMNQTIPDLDMVGAMRTLGNTLCPVMPRTTLAYGPSPYSRGGLETAVQAVGWPGGATPLAEAINAASEDLAEVTGQIAVIVISDGEDLDMAPVAAAQAMKSTYGDRVCIYTVATGAGKSLMEKIAQAGDCGFSIDGNELTSATGMSDFVKAVFLKEAARPAGPVDSDGDGVYDDADRCPGTPRGISVDRTGCPLDSDGDGVYDYEDKCPKTPSGVSVDPRGCPLDTDGDGVYDYLDACRNTPAGAKVNQRGCWTLAGLRFDTGKSTIKPESYPILNEVVTVLKRNPDLKVRIEGHTDNVGKAAYNQGLSEDRAQTVEDYLLKVGIAQERLSSKGFGLTRPAASNETAKGRAQNRRVELTPVR